MILQTPHYWKPEYPEYYSAAGWELDKALRKAEIKAEIALTRKLNRITELTDQIVKKLTKLDFGKDHERFEMLTGIAHRLFDLHKRLLCNTK